MYKVDIASVLKPKVGGLKADKFIQLSGFERSQRVKADGFSGGIWILWNNAITVDIASTIYNLYISKSWIPMWYGHGSPLFMLAC